MDKDKFLLNLGKRIGELRKAKGLSQEELANIIDVHRTYIGFIEQGKRNPSVYNLYKIAQALKSDLKDLL